MFKPSAAALSLAAAAVLVAAPALSADGGRKLDTSLTGAAEVPGPADPDGGGTAGVTVNSGQNQVCYTLAVSNIATATMAHIHKAAVGVAGPVVVALTRPGERQQQGLRHRHRELALDILKSPADYYVNVHNAPFPAGAIRGQLAK
jgi:hypothetical protein